MGRRGAKLLIPAPCDAAGGAGGSGGGRGSGEAESPGPAKIAAIKMRGNLAASEILWESQCSSSLVSQHAPSVEVK